MAKHSIDDRYKSLERALQKIVRSCQSPTWEYIDLEQEVRGGAKRLRRRRRRSEGGAKHAIDHRYKSLE